MSEATSVRTFAQLQTEVAELLGIAYYGVGGNEIAQAPVDTQDAERVKRIVNNGIRMFISDAPASGWNWLNPNAAIVLWSSVAVDATVTATGVYDGSAYTTITATESVFYETMELHDLTITDVGTYEIVSYVSSTQVKVAGDHAFAAKTFSVTADGNYTLPSSFTGEYTGRITYAASSGTGTRIDWTDTVTIRQRRTISGTTSGTPCLATVRKMATNRRWELMVYPIAGADYTVEFPYNIQFDLLSAATDLHPAGAKFDEAILAACLARAEMDGAELAPGRIDYYRQVALPNAYRLDARSRPRNLGKMSMGRSQNSLPAYRTSDWRVNYG